MVFVFPGDNLSFKIEVELMGKDEAHNVVAKDVLPEDIIYQGNLRVNDQTVSGDISNIPLSVFVRKQLKTITFDARVSSKNKFNLGLTTLTNRAYVKADNFTEVFDSAAVNVNNLLGEVGLSISKMAKNITKGDTEWKNEVAAAPGDTLQFQIKIVNAKTTAISGTKIKDILHSKLAYAGNLLIDGVVGNRDVGADLVLGEIGGSQTRTITYDVKVTDENNFNYGATEIINVADVYNDNFALFATAKIIVTKKGVLGATDVITGINVLYIALMAGLISAILLYALFFYLDNSQRPFVRKLIGFLVQIKLLMFR
ncbi:MAG: hypothetical protein A2654_00885 [Candidatus Nealsonbacteria bacterium RIFCSPHIGHO2_01_FULL_43_31]|nr:MAG: hypothetical protein A2654_00885 [Candidatus Nealsonbacteria bacterium RIFCSPHIGHO2_01_FULL_43_31]OGZ21731.1 MAG: hypothetical protein A3D46_01675 [Candidatus Nealsonbacteria bacterium RIFCSPHIGHO2_02_FULL_43_13]OGZ25222.1 MAG: hypothetical protein A2922_00065 [Candidatus Nealsonbacteria bacterium RIFCSPLOWO2_01_FULL_43_36]